MLLIDTCVWVDLFDRGDALVREQLSVDLVLIHPYIVGELAMGNMAQRSQTIRQLMMLNIALPLRHFQIMALIEQQALFGTGLQYVDAHLLGTAITTAGCRLWTRDKKLRRVAERLGVAASFA